MNNLLLLKLNKSMMICRKFSGKNHTNKGNNTIEVSFQIYFQWFKHLDNISMWFHKFTSSTGVSAWVRDYVDKHIRFKL